MFLARFIVRLFFTTLALIALVITLALVTVELVWWSFTAKEYNASVVFSQWAENTIGGLRQWGEKKGSRALNLEK